MSPAFTAGDIVQLKSGGEPMTVEEVNGQLTTRQWLRSCP